MFRRILLAVLLMACGSSAFARGQFFGYVQKGGKTVSVAGFTSNTKVQQSYPLSTVSVYLTGTTTLATLYSDSGGTALANPFAAGSDGSFTFFTDTAVVDITFSGAGITTSCGTGFAGYPCISAFTWTGIAVNQIAGTTISVTSYGAVADGRSQSDGIASSGNTSFTSALGSFTSADTGKLVFIYGAGVAGADFTTTATFVNSTTITLGSAPSTSVNPATYYIGTDNTTAIQSALTAAANAKVVAQPPGGVHTCSAPEILFPNGLYLVSNEISTTTACISIQGQGTPAIVQTDNTKRILVFNGSYQVAVRRMGFTNGKYAIDYRNDNLDAAQLILDNDEFQRQASYAIWTSSSTMTAAPHTGIPYSTGKISVTAASPCTPGVNGNVWTGSGGASWDTAATPHNQEFYDLHLTATDEWYKVAEVTGATTLYTNRCAPTTRTNVDYEIVDSHLSAHVIMNACRFYNVNKVIFANTEETVIRSSWVTVIGDTSLTNAKFSANSAAFRNFYGALTLDNMLGVAQMGVAGSTLISSPRWVDMDAGSFYSVNRTRFGNDGGGMACVWYMIPYLNIAPYQGGGQGTSGHIVIRDSFTSCGQSTAAVTDPGVVVLKPNGRAATGRENVPIEYIYKNNEYLSGVPILNNAEGLDINTFIGTGLANTNVERKFRYDVGPNSTAIDSIGLSGTWNGLQQSIYFNRFTGGYPMTVSLNFGTVNAGTCTSQTTNVSGAIDGDDIKASPLNAVAANMDLLDQRAWVSTSDTGLVAGIITVRLCNPTAATNVATGGATNWVIWVRKNKWISDTP